MKTFLFIKTLAITVCSVLFLFSCGEKTAQEDQSKNTSNTATTTETNPDQIQQSEVDNKTKEHVNEVLDKYYSLKSALVETDAQKAKSAGEKLAGLIENFDTSNLQADLLSKYESISEKIHQHAETVAQAEDIEVQRQSFSDITAGVYEMVKTYNVNDEEVYYAYCPMAFNDNGGYWLSAEKEIKNPYFGSKMMKCGSIRETIAEN